MADPRYQFPNRWAEIGGLLFPEPTPEQQRALSLLEQKDRDAEDHWGGSGGTLQSIISVDVGGINGSFDSSGVDTTDSSLAIAVPADTSFTYYVDWHFHGIMFLINNETDTSGLFFQGFAQVQEHSPGAGFERHGWALTAPASVSNGSASPFTRYYLTGHGHRVEQLEDGLAGTTVHLQLYYKIAVGSTDIGQYTLNTDATLIAIPK